ncbi:OLC1v1023401C1 [Oldenlandia corymbosa var. corymbosa]|uniref:ubiquitinyl hydrolase 1 n=1 Tax=Oldenlandia corymbosa var. corymbosa TaxID=529605 RepID=A0AAV1C0D1_OLDCO|nr:OLC1v1023401C1 [Oldenlandia corymbosa var. corymbosa]
MLEPRETDIPALFLVFVVLPLVAYFLLGKWSESTKQIERISLLAQQAAEEALQVEVMATASVIPVLPLPNSSTHQCARCFGPTTTRCKRCKSVWYCSGKCQIIHWREVHKHECQQVDNHFSNSSPKLSTESECQDRVSFDGKQDMQSLVVNFDKHVVEKAPLEKTSRPSLGSLPSAAAAGTKVDTSATPVSERRSMDKRPVLKSSKGALNRVDEPLSDGFDQLSVGGVSCSPYNAPVEDDSAGEKVRENKSSKDREVNISSGLSRGQTNTRNSQEEGHMLSKQSKHAFDARKTHGTSSSANSEMSFGNTHSDSVNGENLVKRESTSLEEDRNFCSLTERASTKRSNKTKSASSSLVSKHHKSPKPTMKSSREQTCLDMEQKVVTAYDSKTSRVKDVVPSQGSNAISSLGIMKMIGLMKTSKLDRQETSEVNAERHKKVKMLFPYEDFVKYFQYEVFNLSPRGLVNCGNSCYANAVLQCLSCTKPLTVFLLRRSHSRSCCARDWCLMCELEQHVMMLREGGGPLSPSRILSHMRAINCQIGDGSQEDAHEFLRFLVASMQSICLEGLGGENMVDPRLQETTFIQHTFGGRLRSKVKCLRCHHESQRSENIMDLTLEIFGWVESLEDALTQFTSPEDLDGENMYRCGRCAAYVRARKQLSIQEAPNILTIVLKRFQEGSYGKINKCITFPDMLDMVPYMTGTDDVPPLYELYAVVVHLDTLNASFSGHYISYIKDLRGTWFKIDDTEVQPVDMSQVMSEGAYILFYMRSSPRPARVVTRKTTSQQGPMMPKHCSTRTQKSSRAEQSRSHHRIVEPDKNWVTGYHSGLRSASGNRHLAETYAQSMSTEFSDVTSSDWSLFTSSDEASFTTESTRDSFSTVDYSDANNMDPFSSIFGNMYTSGYHPSQKTLACNMFSTSRPQTIFFSEEKGSVVEYFMPPQPPQTRLKGKNSKRASLSDEAFQTHGMHVNYGNDSRTVPFQTL